MTLDGIKLKTSYSDSQTLAFFRQRDNRVLDDAIRSLRKGAAFVDVGANIGYYSLMAAKLTGPEGRCLAFEPSSREFSCLLANRDANFADNIIAINSALSEHIGVASLSISPRHHGLNTIGQVDSTRFFSSRQESVATFSGDSIIKPIVDRESIDLVKIDVEGTELKVLKGMSSLLNDRCISALCVEITDLFLQQNGDSAHELYQLMNDFGYSAKVNSTAWQYDELFVRDP